jgi:hypothetical protein
VILLIQEVRGGWLFLSFLLLALSSALSIPTHFPINTPQTQSKILCTPQNFSLTPNLTNLTISLPKCERTVCTCDSKYTLVSVQNIHLAESSCIKHFHYSSNPSPGWISRPTPQCTRICITTFARTRLIKSLRWKAIQRDQTLPKASRCSFPTPIHNYRDPKSNFCSITPGNLLSFGGK